MEKRRGKHIKQIDKDLLILGCIASLQKELGLKMTDLITHYDGSKLADFAEMQSVYLNDEATQHAIKELANECYNRVYKKFKKEVKG
jgi:hypothetical protein